MRHIHETQFERIEEEFHRSIRLGEFRLHMLVKNMDKTKIVEYSEKYRKKFLTKSQTYMRNQVTQLLKIINRKVNETQAIEEERQKIFEFSIITGNNSISILNWCEDRGRCMMDNAISITELKSNEISNNKIRAIEEQFVRAIRKRERKVSWIP